MSKRLLSQLALIASLTLIYFAAGKLGLRLAFVNASATAVWPPTGIALAAALLLGYRIWPAILLGAFLVNVTTSGTVATSSAIAVGNTLEVIVGTYLVNRFAHGRQVFDRARDIFTYVILMCIVSTAVSATIGVTSLTLSGLAAWANYGPIWLTWWLGDAVGALVVAPVLVLWAINPRVRWNRSHGLEAILLCLAALLLGLTVFGGLFHIGLQHYPLEFLLLPIIVWVAFRFTQREAATLALSLSGIALWGTLSGFGPFARDSPNEALLLLQAFMGMITLTCLGMAAVVAERQQARAAAEQANVALQATQAELERQRDHLAVALNEREAAVVLHRSIEERLLALTEAASRLLSSPSQYHVLPAILDLSRQLVAADAYAVWRANPNASEWQVVRAVGLSESFQETVARSPVNTRTIPTQPVLIPDVAALPALTAHRMENYRREGIHALLVMPLRIHGEITATLVFYYRQPHPLSDLEVRVATALAHLSGAALTTAELYDAQHQLRIKAEAAQRDQAFLAEASGILGSSLDYSTTFTTIAHLAVPQLGDWCGVYLVNEHGTIQQVAVAHHDPLKAALAEALLHQYPPTPDRAHGLMQVIQTGQPILVPHMDTALFEAIAHDAEHLRLLRELGVASYLLVPLSAGDRTVGVLAFGRANTRPPFSAEHLPLTQELAHRAAIAVENARLYRAAQAAIQLREQFLSVAAHELKTPLTTLKGYAELLLRRVTREGTFSPRDVRALQTVVEHAHRLDTLIATLLDVSRLEAGQLQIAQEVVDLHTLTDRVVTEMEQMAEQHTIALTGQDEPLTVIGDELRLEQVLNNLIGNAIKYSPAGGAISVQLERQDGLACISVSDQGIGIPAHALPHLFERFYRADNVDERHISGVGIGLYIVKEIVTLHGGSVTVESTEGQSSTFRIFLPVP